METEGLETVHTSLGGNAVVPEGGSFLEPPSIAKVPGEEIFRKLMDQVPCLVEKNEKQAHKDEGFDITEEGETKEIAEKEKQVDDVTGTILQIDKIEGPSVNIEEEERIVKHVEAMEDGEADVEGKPKSIEKETGGPEKYEEGEMKIEESVELETSNEVGSFEPGLSQGKEALSQTADAIVNNLDNPETVKEVCQEKEIKDSGTGDGTINEQRIGEERKEGEKSGSCSSFLDDKGTDVVKAIEMTEKEKEGTTCDTMGGGTYIVEAGIDIQNEKETTPGTGEGMQDKRNTEDIATVTHKTQETEEMYSKQVDKPDVCMVSESESEEIVNKSPQGEGQNLILEKTAEVDSSEGENIKDGMDPEQKPDGLFVKHEENKQSMHQDLAMAEESTEENRDMETPTVIAAENNTSDAVPITITTAQDHSVIEDDKIMDVVANVVPEDSKEEMSKYEDRIKETFAQQDEAVNEKSENSLALISGEIDTATSSECSEAIASAKEETPIKIPGESFEDKKEEKPIDADAVVDSGLPIEKSLLPTDLNEKIEDAGLELQYKNSSEMHISHSLEQETIPVQDEKQPKVSDFEPQEQDHEENGPSKDLEKHAEDASEACESMQNTNLENPSAEGAKTTEVNSKANEMAVEKEEKIHELESEEKLAIDDAGTNLEEEKQKKEEDRDEQAYQMATSDRIEEVTSDEVCSREFVDKKVERSVQAAGFQEAETPLKNGVGENYEMSSIVNEEVIDEPKITDIGEVIDEERIKDDATHPSSELVFDEKLVESSQDKETEAEMSKGDGVEEQMMKDDNAKVILQESIQEASVNDFQNDLKDAEKSGREMSEVSEAEEKDETNNNDESPDSTLQASLLKEQESLQTENLTAEAEEKDEDGSSIIKDEDEDNDNGLKEFKECSEKETLKGEEDVEQISPKNELGENLESSASMISAETEEVALNKTTQETEEEMDEGVEGVKKEAETGKEDGEEQVIDENDAKSIPIESIKEVTISKLLDDENNAEEFIREISEESVAAGTNESITDATYQNDGTTPDAAPETSTAKETLKDEEDVEQIPPKNDPGENLESSASMIPAETEEVALNKTTQETEEEMNEGVEGVYKEAETGKEDGEEQVNEENDAKSIPVESIKEVTVSKLLDDENNAEEFKREISEESVAAGTNENITDMMYQNDGTTPNAALEASTAKETLKDEEDVEQISPMNEPGENLESSASMISAETEEVALNKTTRETEEEMDEGVEGVKKEAETGKKDGEEQVIDENDAKSILVESIKEVPVSKLLDDENNAEEFKREIYEESVAIETNESIIDETHQNDGTPNAALETSTVKQVEIVQGEGKDTIPAEASPKEEEEHDPARGFKRVGDNSSEIRLEEDLEKSDEETSKKIDAVAHETNQHIEFPSSTLETSPVEEQASVQRDNLTPEETSPEEKIYEDGSSNKKDEDKEKNTGLAEETRNAGETLKAEESLEQILQNDNLIENPKQSINMICAETEADAFSKMVDNHEEEIVEIPRGNAEAELLKEENIEVHVVEESNINRLSQESAEESPIKDFQNAAKNSEKSTEEMLESQIAGGDETNTNDEDCNSSLTISVDKIDESFEGEDKNITTAEASTHDEKEEHGSLEKAGEGNDGNRDLTVTNQDSTREASKVQEDSQQELQRIEPGEPEESSTVMAAETEAGTLSDKIDDATSQEEVVTIENIEETVEKEKKEEHGPLDRADDGNDSNPDLTVTDLDSAREASKVQEDSEQELQRIEPGEPEESSTVMAAETEAGTLSDKIDDITSQEQVVTIQNIEETIEKEKKEEHGPLDKAGEGNDSNPDLTVTNQDSAREASKVQEDSEQELQRIEPGEPEESSTVMAAETKAGTLSDKIDDVASQEEVATIQNIEETVEKEKKEEHGPLDRADDGNDSNPDLTVTNQDSAREASKVQEDSEQELPRIEPGELEESSTVRAAQTETGTLSDKIDDVKSQEEVVTVPDIEETVEKEKKEEHGSLDKAGEGNDSNPDLTLTNQDSVREASKVQEDSEQELQRIEPGEPEESSTVMAAETKAGTLSDKIDDVTSQEEVATIQKIEDTVEKEKKEEHGPLERAGDGNDSNPDPTVTNQDSAREASKVQEDSEQELPRIEPGELEESSTVMAAETETGTLSDKIDDVTSQEEVVKVPNIEETVEKEKKEEHGSMDKAGEGHSNPDLTVTNQDSAREASKVQEDSEQELQRIEPGEPEESSTVMAAETEAGTLSDKIDDVPSQEEVVTIENIEETVEKEKKEEHGPLDKADDGNDSNPDLTVTDPDSAREASKVQEDSEQELQRIEPGEPEESSTIMAAETEVVTLSDQIDDVTSQEEVVTVPNIEETIEKEKKEGSEDIDVTKVKRAVMEEDLKLVAEASDANKSVENDAEDENIISGGKEVETVEKKFELDSIQKLEVEEKRENKEEEAKNEDIKEVCGDTKLASLSVDAEKHVTAEEHTNTDISPQTTGETTAEEKAETVKEMEESVVTSVDEDAEKKVPEEESESAINDQSKIIYKGDESGMLVEQEVHEIIQTAEEYGDIGKQGSAIKDSYEAPLSSTNEEIPLHKETEDESDKVKPNEEVKDSKSEFTEPFEARGSVDRQEFETLRGEQGPNSDIYLVKASEGVSEKERNKSPVEISYFESESKGEILEEVQPDVNDSSSALTTGIARETSFKEAEPEDKRQIESFEPAPQEKGPVTESTERTTLESVDIDAKPEDSNFIENEDHGIPAASEAEELKNEMHEETPITGIEDYKEETTNETSLGNVLDDKQVECSTMLPKEPELITNEGNKATDENSTTYENIETPQTPQEIEIMLKEDMPINARDASKSVDPRIESIKEEVGSYQFDNLNEHHELDNEKQEGIDISKSSEVRDLANQGEICKLMSLEDEYSSNVGDEALKCIEATSAERKEAVLEEDNSTKKSEDSFTDNVEANKAAFELEEGTNNQEQAIGTKDYGVLAEENFEVSESGKKLEGVSESETGDQSSQKIPETDPGKVENITEIQNRSLKSVEQSSLESQEVREETGEKTEPRFETEGDVKETQSTDETVKDVLLTEEVHQKVDKAGSETLKCTEKDVNDTLELCAKSTEDERVHEVKQSSLIAEECQEATESNEQTAIMSSDLQEAPTMEEMSLAKAINDEDNEMPAVLSTTKTAEESDEMIKIIKEEDSCCDKIKATTMVEIAKTSLEEAQLDEKQVQVSNITSDAAVSLEIEAEACQQEKIKDIVGLELPSNLASPIPIDDHENIMREQVAKENADADDVQENERASDVVYESKDHGIEELITSKIKEENEKSSEIESLGVEAAANEIAIDQNPPEVISTEEQGISATTERREENVKDVELLEDDLRKTEEVPLQMDDCRERDISQLELQSNKDTQNQSPKEVLEEECGTPDETKEEIKEGTKLVSMTSSQGFEALKEDESTSGQTVPEEKLEEQNQTPAAALLTKEKDCGTERIIENIEDCGTERIIENIEECVQVEIPTDPQNDSPKKITEDTCLHKKETNELEVSGFGVELNTGMQKDSLNEVQVEESKSPDDASKLQTPEYETSKEAFESMSEAHGHKGFTASQETEIEEKHPEVAITDLTAGEDRSEKIIDPAEIIHDEVIEEGTFERTSNLKTEVSKEAFKSISEVHGREALAESEDTEIKEKNPEVTVTDMAAEENQSERTIDATEIIHDKLKSEELTKRENQEIMEEKEGAKNGDPVTLGEETTKECQEEYELKAEESLGDKGTQKDIQNEELYKEAEKADGIEKQMDTERIIEHLHLAAAENETMKESFLDEAGSELHLGNQICEKASGNDGRTEAANVKEEEMDVEISQKEVPTDLVEANEATRDIHEEEETSKTTTEHIEEHVKEVEIEVDEHPSAPKTTENTCSQKEETKEQEVCGSGVECSTDMQKNGSNEFDEEEGRTPDEDSTPQPQGYENKIKDKEYLPESNKMTEITETGAFEKTSDLRAETGEEAFKSVSEVHEHEVLAESEHAEIKEEKHSEVAVTDLVAGENQNKKTIAATEVVHDELPNEELTKQDKQQFKEEEEDTKNCNPINLGEETTKESRQIHDLKAEESQEDKMETEIQNEEVSNESGEYLHQTAVENETINESFPDEALVENAEDMGTKLQVEKHSDEKTSGYDRTEAITNEEFGTEISEKESLQAPAEANETTQDIHQGERDSDSTSEKPIPLEAEPQETTERKKDAPQVLLQEPIVEATQGAGVGESEPGKATGIVDAQGFEHKAERSIDEENIRGNDESMSAKTSLFDMMQSSTRERQVGGDLTEETRVEGEKAKSDEEKEEEEEEMEEEGEEHKKTDSGSDAPVMVEASMDIVDVKVASKKHYNILSGVGSKVKNSISKVKKAITGKSSHPKQHSPK